MNPSVDDQIVAIIIIAAFVFIVLALRARRWRPSGTAFGTAAWMSDHQLRAGGFLAGTGLIVGRTFGGALIRIPDYCHCLLTGGTGSGKGVSIIIPNLLSYDRGSIVCFDTKGDLYEAAGKRRAARGERIIHLAPFNGGRDAFNPLDTIPRDSPLLVDAARALAEALVVRQGTESDPHWNDKSAQALCAVSVLSLLVLPDAERNLNSVQEIFSDVELLRAAAQQLRGLGGIPARLGHQLGALFEKDGAGLTKEGVGVVSTVTRNLSFLDSELVAKAVAASTFDPRELRRPGKTLFLQIPPEQLEAQRGLLRCWISTLVTVISAAGNGQESEVLFLLDEASALGSLPAIEEALVRGRSAGVRLLLAYQSHSQITTASKNKPTLLYDNCNVQIYIGAPSSYETAERLSKSLGDYTQILETFNENESSSRQSGGQGQEGSNSYSRGSAFNYSESGRALSRPEELLTQSNDRVIVLQRGMAPILANRVKWYENPEEFNPGAPKRLIPAAPGRFDLFAPWWKASRASITLRLIAAAILGLILWAITRQQNPW